MNANSVPAAAPGLRLTAKGRRALALLIATPALLFGALLGAGILGDVAAGANAAAETGPGDTASQTFEYVTVQPGQSLWQIAERLAPDADPREVVAEIELLNGLSGALQAGERLAVPLQYSSR